MNLNKTLSIQSFLPRKNPKKLIFMLHGYGDNADKNHQACVKFELCIAPVNIGAVRPPGGKMQCKVNP